VEYVYIRSLVNGMYNIDNPERVDGEGNRIHLAKEIEAEFPDWDFNVRNNGSVCKIVYSEALTAPEKTTLDGIVIAHKNNT